MKNQKQLRELLAWSTKHLVCRTSAEPPPCFQPWVETHMCSHHSHPKPTSHRRSVFGDEWGSRASPSCPCQVLCAHGWQRKRGRMRVEVGLRRFGEEPPWKALSREGKESWVKDDGCRVAWSRAVWLLKDGRGIQFVHHGIWLHGIWLRLRR